MLKIAVNGALGKMGVRILALGHEQPNDFKVVQAFDLDACSGKMITPGLTLESLSANAKGEIGNLVFGKAIFQGFGFPRAVHEEDQWFFLAETIIGRDGIF